MSEITQPTIGQRETFNGQDYSWNGSEWVLAPRVRPGDVPVYLLGPRGVPGENGQDGSDGEPGAAGKSAYILAVEAGFVGTMPQWLASLKGENGSPGNDGNNGQAGVPGEAGSSAYALAVSNGFVGTLPQWLASLKGENGSPGNDGNNGQDGAPGSDGASAYALALSNGFVGTMPQWLDSLKGADGVDGQNGSDGAPGTPGQGVPTGGSTGQVLAKTGSGNYQTGWIDPPAGSGGGSGAPAFDWTSARRVKVIAMEGGALAYDGMYLARRGNEVAKTPTSGVYTQNKLDSVNGLYLQYPYAAPRLLVGVTHQSIKYSRARGFRIAHHFGLEQTGDNATASFFMGLSEDEGWGSDVDSLRYLCTYRNRLGVGFNDNQANWQIVIPGYGHTKYYVDTGVAKPTGSKILYAFEMKCEPGSNLVHVYLYDATHGVVIADQFVEVYSDTEAGAAGIGTIGDHGKIGYHLHYYPSYFHSYYTTGDANSSLISYVFCRTYAETPG